MSKNFDLNIEQVLEHWEMEHAIREIISNALDERLLSDTKEIKIFKKNDKWYIRDYGRGLEYTHFTQNENKEKLESENLIGKFGVGLKDALAVFYRKGVKVEINSKYASIGLIMSNKTGFNIETLHAVFNQAKDETFVGTEFIINGVTDEQIAKAKAMFLCFSNVEILEKTKYGEIYNENSSTKSIFINGVKVASEDNFLFSYNITSLNTQVRKALNRERSNVGRTAYSETLKNMLKQCKMEKVLFSLVEDLENTMRGTNKDESGWVDVATHAAKTLNTTSDVVFMTPYQRSMLTNQQVEILNNSGKKLIMITDNVYYKIESSINTFDNVYEEYEKNFEYKFIDYSALTSEEKYVFDMKSTVIKFLKNNNYNWDAEIKISETIMIDAYGIDTLGLCVKDEKLIIIKRSQLNSQTDFLATLTHEFAHYTSGFSDNTREFENILTKIIGLLISENINNSENSRKANYKKERGLFSKIFNKF